MHFCSNNMDDPLHFLASVATSKLENPKQMGTNIDLGISSGNEIENTPKRTNIMEEKSKEKRFAAPLSEKSLNVLTKPYVPMKTQKSIIEWAMGIFKAWVRECNESGDLLLYCREKLPTGYPLSSLKFDRGE